MRWGIRERRAGGGGRQAHHIDIVLDRNGYAEQRQRGGIRRAQAFGLGERIRLVAQADEDCWIVVVADALIAACDRLGGRELAQAMRGDNRGDGFDHTELRSGQMLRLAMADGAPRLNFWAR